MVKRILVGVVVATSLLGAQAAANVLPSVSLTSPLAGGNYVGPATIALSATAADSDGAIAKVAYYRDAVLIGTATVAPYAFNWANAAAGTYSITARATDNAGGVTISSPVAVLVKTNVLPTVTLTSPAANTSFASPGTVNLSVNAADSDGTITKVTYFQGTTAVRTATVAPFDAVWTNVAVGNYSITAKAYDDKGGITTTAAVPIAVNTNVAPTVSVSAPAAGQDLVSPGAITLSATAADSDGTIARVGFYDNGALKGTVLTPPYTLPLTNVQAGTHSITARATDDKGVVTISAPVDVVVKANAAPTVRITSFASPTTFNVPGLMTMTATAADSDGSIAKVVFFHGTTEIGTATAAPYTVTWNNPVPATYNVTAKAYDNKGVTGASLSMTVHVKGAPVPVVSMLNPTNGARYIAPAAIALSASATVSGDTISKVEYISAGTLIGTATSAPYALNLTNVPVGTYNVSAKATGVLGGMATSSVVDLVVAENTAPVVGLTASQSSQVAPANVALAASASDADGAIAKVELFNGAALLTSMSEAPFNYTWTGVGAGTYSVTARATDNLGLVATSAPTVVTVGAAAPTDTSQTFYIYSDQINTAREIIDAAGTTVWQADPDAFGANLPNEIPAGRGQFTYNQRFPGQYFDGESGLHYNYFREYDPQTGRYVQSDPIGLGGGINTYGYVGGNPLSYVDPEGLQAAAPMPGPGILFAIGGVWWQQVQAENARQANEWAVYNMMMEEAAGYSDEARARGAPMAVAQGNQVDSDISDKYEEYASGERLCGKKPDSKCDWLEKNKGKWSADRVKRTGKAWGCIGSRHNKGGSAK